MYNTAFKASLFSNFTFCYIAIKKTGSIFQLNKHVNFYPCYKTIYFLKYKYDIKIKIKTYNACYLNK